MSNPSPHAARLAKKRRRKPGSLADCRACDQAPAGVVPCFSGYNHNTGYSANS